MSNTREAILNQVRAALGKRSVDNASVRSAAQALLADPAATRPAPGAGSLADRFIEKVTSPRVAATVTRLSAMAEVPAAVSDYLQARGLPRSIALQPNEALRALDWSAFGLGPALAEIALAIMEMKPGDHPVAVEGDVIAQPRGELRIGLNPVESPVQFGGNGPGVGEIGNIRLDSRWRVEAGKAGGIRKMGHCILSFSGIVCNANK